MSALLMVILVSLPWLSEEAPAAVETVPPVRKDYAVGAISAKVREFRRLGDAVLRGDPQSHDARLAMARALSSEFSALDPSAWKDADNAAALLLLVLFGGDAHILRSATQSGQFCEPYMDIARALIDYAERRLEQAGERLATLDRAKVPSPLVAPLALLQGTLTAVKDPAGAVRQFEKVRVGAPGSTLEEAAIRQQVLTELRAANVVEVVRLFAVYVRRFPRSLYAAQFIEALAGSLAATNDDSSEALVAESRRQMPAEEMERYVELMGELSKRLLLAGKFAPAGRLATHLAETAEPGSAGWRKAELMRLVCGASQENPGRFRDALMQLDRQAYAPDERELIDAAIVVARDIMNGTGAPLATGKDVSKSAKAGPAHGAGEIPAHLAAAAEAARPVPPELGEKITQSLRKAKGLLEGGM